MERKREGDYDMSISVFFPNYSALEEESQGLELDQSGSDFKLGLKRTGVSRRGAGAGGRMQAAA